MPDYKRLVSYIYNYEDGVKRNNVGYARVEARNGQCKCTLHITAPSINDKQLKAYMFQRKKGGPEGILLGVLQIKNGIGDFKIITDSSHIMNSPYGLDDLGGIVLYLSERKFFATEWDDSPVTMKMVTEIESKEADKARRLQSAAAEKERRLAAETEKEKQLSAEKERQLAAEAEKDRRAAQEKEKEMQLSQAAELEQEVKAADIAVLYLDSQPKRLGKVINSRLRSQQEEPDKERPVKEEPVKEEPVKEEPVKEEPVKEESVKEEAVYEESNKDVLEKEEFDIEEVLHSELKTSGLSETVPEDKGACGCQSESENRNTDEPSGSVTLLDQEENVLGLGNYIQEENDDAVNSEDLGNLYSYSESENITEEYNTYENSFNFQNFQYESVELNNSELNNSALGNSELNNPASEVYSEEQNPEGSQEENNPDQEGVTAEAIQSEECLKEDSGKFYDDHPIAKRIYRSFPRMYPFEDNEIAWCVKIEPQDIGLFPMEAWVLGNNSFLLHGYYSYRHLIFAKINDKNGFNYILGVPGIYHNREKFMAKMFGFENFKCVKRKAQRTGEFGYWYVPIILN